MIRLLALDSFGTLFDVERGLSSILGEAGVEDVSGFASDWFKMVKRLTQEVNASGQFQPFGELLEAALEEMAQVRGVSLTEPQRARVIDVWRKLPIFEDVKGSLQTWRDSGAAAWIITNGDLDTVQALLEANNIAGLIQGIFSAAAVETYKPARAVYSGASSAAGVLPAQMVMATALPLDVEGAKAAGLQAAWIRRNPSEAPPKAADWTVDSLRELISLLQPLLPRPDPGQHVV